VDDLRAQPAPYPYLPRLVGAPNAKPILGTRLLTPLSSCRFGAVGPCEAPAGLFHAIPLVLAPHTRMDGDSALPPKDLLALPSAPMNPSPCPASLKRVELVGVD
jgi:hypothetical protein